MLQAIFGPKWLREIPPHLRPRPDLVRELEHLRQQYGIPQEALAWAVVASDATTRKVQRQTYLATVRAYPHMTERERLQVVLASRGRAAMQSGEPWTAAEWEAAERVSTFAELCEFVLRLEAQSAPPDTLGFRKMVAAILRKEEGE